MGENPEIISKGYLSLSFAYIHSEKDILKLTTTLIANTKGDGKAGDEFWTKAETLLYCALIGYIHYEAPLEEQNFATLIEFLNAMEVREDDETFQNPVDQMFEALKKKNRTTLLSANMPSSSWRRVLYALKDFLIKRLGSLLEHTT